MSGDVQVRFCERPRVKFPRATHLVVGFEHEADARQFQIDLSERLKKFALELHPEKTRLIRFGRKARSGKSGRPGTFDFLGLTHICGKSRKGGFLLLRRTARKRMQVKLKGIRQELLKRKHLPIPEQGRWIGSVVRGYFAYHAVPTNSYRLGAFRLDVIRSWQRSLVRRGQRRPLTRERIRTLARRWIPPARILHPWPSERFDARTRGGSRVR